MPALGIGRGDTVAIMLTNRPEFHPVDSAAMHLGATPFSIYNTYTPDQIKFLVNDAATRVVVTEQAFLDTVLKAKEGAEQLEHVVVIDGDAPDGGMTLDELIAKADDGFDFEAAWKAVDADDILTLIYTSGTTGDPKGVQLTHKNLLTAVKGYHGIIDFPEEGSVVSWLPMAHIAERACSHYIPILLGFTTTSCPDPRQVVSYLPEVRPTWFFAVPRIWEKLKAAIEAGIEAEQDEQKKAVTKTGARGRPQARRADPVRPGGPEGARAAVAEVRRARRTRRCAPVSGSTAWSRSTSAQRRRRPR